MNLRFNLIGCCSSISDLLGHVTALQQGAAVHPAPAAGQAQIVRVAGYNGDQLVGGYTLVIRGA